MTKLLWRKVTHICPRFRWNGGSEIVSISVERWPRDGLTDRCYDCHE